MQHSDISQHISGDITQDIAPDHAAMQTWRISTVSGALVAAYFIPTWTIFALRIMVSPIQGFYERPNISLALYLSDIMQVSSIGTVRYAWLLALGKLTVVAFFAVFLAFITRAKIRRTGGCDEALAMALGISGTISFGCMLMAAKVHELAAMRLHATELLLVLGVAVLMAVESRHPVALRQSNPLEGREGDVPQEPKAALGNVA